MHAQRLARLGVAGAAVAVLAAVQACYNYVPVETVPPTGEHVSLVVTDQGRVALADRFGPGIETIEGKLVGIQDSNYIINVSRVAMISGSHALWTGEQSSINRTLVGSLRTRQLSVWRTVAAGAVVAGSIVALAASGVVGGGVEPDVPTDTTKQPASVRIPLTIRIPLHF